jgi:hypothetical protein
MGCTSVVYMTATTDNDTTDLTSFLKPEDKEFLAQHAAYPKREHFIAVLDHTGDTRTMWNPGVQAEVDAAKKVFAKLRKQGYLAYKVGENGEPDETIHDFDPTLGAIVMSPQIVGG